jgi:hypothetical protein
MSACGGEAESSSPRDARGNAHRIQAGFYRMLVERQIGIVESGASGGRGRQGNEQGQGTARERRRGDGQK